MRDGGWGNPLGEPAPNTGYCGGTRPQRGFIWRLLRGYCGGTRPQRGLSRGYRKAIVGLSRGY